MEQKTREYNMELFRIVAMFLVIVYHCILHSMLLKKIEFSGANFALEFLNYLAGICNISFLLISGYYMINSKFKLNKILMLWGKTLFYSIIIYLIYLFINGQTSHIYESFFPIISGHYWFISAYIVLYFLAPILNICIKRLTKVQFQYLLIVLTVIYGVITPAFNPKELFTGRIEQVLYVYLVGAYLGLHYQIKETKKHYFLQYVAIIFGTTVLSYLIKYLMFWLANVNCSDTIFKLVYQFRDGLGIFFTSIFSMLAALSLFMKFKTMQIRQVKLQKIIAVVSPSVFSVYLIHEHVKNKIYLWRPVFNLSQYHNSYGLILRILLIAAFVFVVCLGIDLIRREIYKMMKKIPYVQKLVDNINGKIDRMNLKMQNIFHS